MVKELSDEMKSFLKDIKENIKNPEDLDYVLLRTEKLFDVVLKQVEEIANYKEEEMNKLQERQKEQHEKIIEMEEKMKQISMDMYDEEYGEFEIICPYCNFNFAADIDENIVEIECPECNNIIELDWNEEENEK